MPRDIPVGNGALLVNFDQAYQLCDLYWPHVGQENHTNGQSTHVIISNERLEENEYRQLRSIEDEYKLV